MKWAIYRHEGYLFPLVPGFLRHLPCFRSRVAPLEAGSKVSIGTKMEKTSEHTRWLALSVSCCLPWLQDRPHDELEALSRRSTAHDLESSLTVIESTSQHCTLQPGCIAPPTIPAATIESPPECRTTAQRKLSEASNRTSIFFPTKRRTTRRPTISGPFDFQQVATGAPQGSGSLRRTGSFRPLQLSIYKPGNELSPLPIFDDEWDVEDKRTDLQFPAPALTKTRSDTMLSRASTTFTIPRKPVPSRAVSIDATSRASMDSNYTCMFSDYKYAAETFVSQTPRRRPSIAASQSTQEFLDALDARLPRSPPAVAMSLPKTVAEPPTVYRRASEQSLRLRTHLEERQQIERKGMECGTILEDLEKTPTVENAASFAPEPARWPRDSLQQGYGAGNDTQTAAWSQNGSVIAPMFDESAFPMPTSPSVTSRTRSRISAWLLRSMTSKSTLLTQSEVSTPSLGHHPPELHDHASAHIHSRDRESTSSSASTLFSTTTAAAEPRPSQQFTGHQHKKGGSVSTTWTSTTAAPTMAGRGMSLDFEKIPVPSSTVTEIRADNAVGVAF